MRILGKDNLQQAFRLLYQQAEVLLANGKQVNAEVTEFKRKRSNEQNSYYFLFNGWVADCLNEAGLRYGEYGIPYNQTLIHEINKQIFGKSTTTKMSIHEFCDYMTQVMVFWQEKTRGELVIPELPNDYLERHGYGDGYFR